MWVIVKYPVLFLNRYQQTSCHLNERRTQQDFLVPNPLVWTKWWWSTVWLQKLESRRLLTCENSTAIDVWLQMATYLLLSSSQHLDSVMEALEKFSVWHISVTLSLVSLPRLGSSLTFIMLLKSCEQAHFCFFYSFAHVGFMLMGKDGSVHNCRPVLSSF